MRDTAVPKWNNTKVPLISGLNGSKNILEIENLKRSVPASCELFGVTIRIDLIARIWYILEPSECHLPGS